MKKFLSLIGIIILLTGCDLSKMYNTPTKQAEMFLSKYQSLDKEVMDDLDYVIGGEINLNEEQRNKYRNIMKKHYQDLVYNIKDEEVNGDIATVIVEIEVTDYSKVLADAKNYFQSNPNEFLKEDGTYDHSKFIDYQLDKLKEAKDKVKYTLYLSFSKIDGKWQINKLSKSDEEKINGIYVY
ncbi:MAG: hypothetical protein GX247_04745 [Mollicutes bacterium]|nr:hypothetical protein [Mollicutes bacterium]